MTDRFAVVPGLALAAPAPQLWSLAGILVAGLVLLLIARFGLRSAFFHIQRESDQPWH
jgi:hypothetical protein